jgi:hypothetical protein
MTHTDWTKRNGGHMERFGYVPGTRNALLTDPEKMPGASWSLPARRSCPRASGTICNGDAKGKGCYAEKGSYSRSSVKRAQAARFDWTVQSMRTVEGREAWVAYMVSAIEACSVKMGPYFRVHDSGDMFNAAYTECWYRVSVELPDIEFWIPTRAWQQPGHGLLNMFDPIVHWLHRLAMLPNVTVRPSALNFGDYAPVVKGLHAGSTADQPDVFRAAQCSAYTRDGHCGPCR